MFVCSGGSSESELSIQRAVQEALRDVFGECGAGAGGVDLLRVRSGACVVRVRAARLRAVRAALLLAAPLRVRAQAASLQALL